MPSRGDRHERSADDQRGHAGSTQGERANNLVCAEAVPPCARKEGQRERRPLTIAHAKARGRVCLWACLRTFVGFFGLWGFGSLGVFWGCLACFLVF